MLIKTLPVGQLETNCYVVTDEDSLDCAVIDPGDESGTILDYLEDNKLHCRAVLLTHAHFDHVGAANALLEATGARLYMCEKELELVKGGASGRFTVPEDVKYYRDGDTVEVGGLRFEVMETPGHTPAASRSAAARRSSRGHALSRLLRAHGLCRRRHAAGAALPQAHRRAARGLRGLPRSRREQHALHRARAQPLCAPRA